MLNKWAYKAASATLTTSQSQPGSRHITGCCNEAGRNTARLQIHYQTIQGSPTRGEVESVSAPPSYIAQVAEKAKDYDETIATSASLEATQLTAAAKAD